MNRLAAGATWLLGAVIGSTLIFTVVGIFARLDRQMWMVFALGIILGLVMRCWPNVRAEVQWSLTAFYMAAYVATLGGAWVLGLDATSLSPTLRSLALHCQKVAAVAAALLALVLVVLAFTDRRKSRWASGWLIGVVVCSALVAIFSGTRGAPGGTAAWLGSLLHIDAATADGIVFFARKAIHFTFYGCFAWFGLRAAEAAGASRQGAIASAFAVALSHACIDEWQQVFSPGRSGSARDVLLDLSGMVVFVLIVTRVQGPSRRANT